MADGARWKVEMAAMEAADGDDGPGRVGTTDGGCRQMQVMVAVAMDK